MSLAVSIRWRRPATLILSGLALALTGHVVSGAAPTSETIEFGGRQRTALVHSPARPASGGAPALMISLHGRGGTGRSQERTSGLSELADQAGFIVAYPDGIERSWNDGRGLDSFAAQREAVDDVGFIIALIDRLVATRGVDPSRVYLSGYSNGGLMAMRLACERPERIAGIAIVARTLTRDLAAACTKGKPVPAIFVMGTADPLVPFAGGQQKIGGSQQVAVLGAAETAQAWARRNLLETRPRRIAIPDTAAGDGTQGGYRLDYGGRAAAGRVALIAVTGGGHTWPGGHVGLSQRIVGRTSQDFAAARAIWRFLEPAPALAPH